jgi:hypothetical protein
MSRVMNVLILGAALSIPVAVGAQDRNDRQEHRESEQSKRYFDKSAKDYHEWNQDEDRRYHEYVKERHLKDRDFNRLNARDRNAYFKWRHEHESDRH